MIVNAPVPHEVFQREGLIGHILINATMSGAVDSVEARVLDSAGAVVSDWVSIGGPYSAASVATGSLTVNAVGGWRSVQVRSVTGGTPATPIEVAPVGVGEIFITAGQSNSTFFSQPPRHTKSGMVSYFDGSAWTLAQDPLPSVDGSTGGSPWALLGDILWADFGVPVAFAPVGWGGTAVAQWLPGDPDGLHARLVLRMQQFYDKGGFRAVLWHQGESDAGGETDRSTYATRLGTVIQAAREAITGPFALSVTPWLIAQASFPATGSASLEVKIGQLSVVDQSTVFYGPDTDIFNAQYRWDGTHMNAYGLRLSAMWWAIRVGECFSLMDVA